MADLGTNYDSALLESKQLFESMDDRTIWMEVFRLYLSEMNFPKINPYDQWLIRFK